MRGALREPVENPVAPIGLRPDLRTGYADGGRTSQGLEHCPSRTVASLFQVLPIRGSPSIVVIRS